jgi:hypothetical protein
LADINDMDKAIAALEFAAANRGLYLTVLALKRASDILTWETAERKNTQNDHASHQKPSEPEILRDNSGSYLKL